MTHVGSQRHSKKKKKKKKKKYIYIYIKQMCKRECELFEMNVVFRNVAYSSHKSLTC